MAKELLTHPTFESDLVIRLACSIYAVLLKLPKAVAADCYQHVYQSFCSRGWVARELQNVHMDDYVEFVYHVRHVYLDELGVGPAVEDMISFLSACPELSGKDYTWNLFKLCFFCLRHVAPKLPHVSLGSSKVEVTGVDLSFVIKTIQGYLLSCDSEGIFFTNPESIASLLELLFVIEPHSSILVFCSLLMFTDMRKFEVNWRNRIKL